MKNRIVISILTGLLSICMMLMSAAAVSTSDAKEKIDLSKKCSLTMTYHAAGKSYAGLKTEIFRIASVDESFGYTLTSDFEKDSITVNGIRSQSEWNETIGTITAYLRADGIQPTASIRTDANGIVSYRELPQGLYYVRTEQITGEDGAIIKHPPFLISLPGIGAYGNIEYDVGCMPKMTMSLSEPPMSEYKAVKLWRDDGDASHRPTCVNIEVYCDEALYDSAVLSDENDWTYSWLTNAVHEWTVVEREIPEDYRVSIRCDEGVFRIVNTKKSSDIVIPPQTGDRSDFTLFILVLSSAGLILTAAGLFRIGKREN